MLSYFVPDDDVVFLSSPCLLLSFCGDVEPCVPLTGFDISSSNVHFLFSPHVTSLTLKVIRLLLIGCFKLSPSPQPHKKWNILASHKIFHANNSLSSIEIEINSNKHLLRYCTVTSTVIVL